MTVAESIRQTPRVVEESIASQRGTLDPLAERLQGRLRQLVQQGGPTARSVTDFLHRTWLGHALHPALTDVPSGAWSVRLLPGLGGAELVMGGGAIELPWHRSTIDLRDGTVVHGRAAVPQPAFEARVRDGNVEARRARESRRGPHS
jgi:hypothetical protein